MFNNSALLDTNDSDSFIYTCRLLRDEYTKLIPNFLKYGQELIGNLPIWDVAKDEASCYQAHLDYRLSQTRHPASAAYKVPLSGHRADYSALVVLRQLTRAVVGHVKCVFVFAHIVHPRHEEQHIHKLKFSRVTSDCY